MMGIEGVLDVLNGGDGGDMLTSLLRKKKNGPPAMQLLPSQQAQAEMGEGALGALGDMLGGGESEGGGGLGAAMGKGVGSGGGQSALMGGLMGGLQGLADVAKPQPMMQVPMGGQNPIREQAITNVSQPPPMSIDMSGGWSQEPHYNEYGVDTDFIGESGTRYPGNSTVTRRPPQDLKWLRKQKRRPQMDYREGVDNVDDWGNPNSGVPAFAYGGFLPKYQLGRVGDGGTDPTAEEFIYPTDDGVQIIPANQPDMRSLLSLPDSQANINSPMPNGIDQTEEGDDTGVGYFPRSYQENTPNLGGLMRGGEDLDSLYRQLADIQNEKHSKWAEAGYGALQGVANWMNHTNQPIQSYSEMRRAEKERPILSKIGQIEHQQDRETQQRIKNAQADYYEQRPDIEFEKIRQRREAAQGVERRAQINVDFRKGVAKPYIDESGRVWKQFLNDPNRPMEPLENPITHEQEFVPGEQGIRWTDPNTGQSITIKAKQSVNPSATIAAGNAQRTTETDKFNAGKFFEARKENINNQLQFQKQRNDLYGELNKLGVVSEPGVESEMRSIEQELTKLYNTDVPEGMQLSDSQITANAKHVNDLVARWRELEAKRLNNAAKTTATEPQAAQIMQQLQQLQAPPQLTFTPVQAAQVSGGASIGTYSEADFIKAAKGRGLTDSQIAAAVADAKQKGIIR